MYALLNSMIRTVVRKGFCRHGYHVQAKILALAYHADLRVESGDTHAAREIIDSIYALCDGATIRPANQNERARTSLLASVIHDAAQRPIPWCA